MYDNKNSWGLELRMASERLSRVQCPLSTTFLLYKKTPPLGIGRFQTHWRHNSGWMLKAYTESSRELIL